MVRARAHPAEIDVQVHPGRVRGVHRLLHRGAPLRGFVQPHATLDPLQELSPQAFVVREARRVERQEERLRLQAETLPRCRASLRRAARESVVVEDVAGSSVATPVAIRIRDQALR